MNLDNKLKSLSGGATVEVLQNLLEYLSEISDVNISINRNYKIGYSGYLPQFGMEFEIIFNDFDGEKWLIHPTSSIRSDRAKKVEFEAQNIRILDDKVTNIYLVAPDSLNADDIRELHNYSKKIHGNEYKSFLTDVLSIFDLGNEILYYATSKIKPAKKSNILGKFAEEYIVFLLNDSNNLILWNDYANNFKTIKSFTFDKFKIILESFGLVAGRDKIYTIYSTTNIPKLANSGLPKTDIVTYISLSNTQYIVKKISVKNTDKKEVSVHQGSVTDLIQAIESSTKCEITIELKDALFDQQKYGGITKLQFIAPKSFEILHEELPKYNKELVAFSIFGDNSPQLVDSRQVADYILYYRNFQIFDKETYIDEYIDLHTKNGQYCTPFKWTFQKSADLNKSIQLKGFTNNKK